MPFAMLVKEKKKKDWFCFNFSSLFTLFSSLRLIFICYFSSFQKRDDHMPNVFSVRVFCINLEKLKPMCFVNHMNISRVLVMNVMICLHEFVSCISAWCLCFEIKSWIEWNLNRNTYTHTHIHIKGLTIG